MMHKLVLVVACNDYYLFTDCYFMKDCDSDSFR